jgi:hypothetical protein
MMKIVKVSWLDIVTISERVPIEIAKESDLAECETVGFLIFEDENKIIVAHSIQRIPQDTTNTTYESVSEYSVIPRGCIIEIKEIK